MRLPSPVHSPDAPGAETILSSAGVPGATPPAAPAAPSAPVAPAAPAAEAPAPTILSGTPAAEPASPVATAAPAPAWGDDWRTKMAGGDEKTAKWLERFTDPTVLLKSHLALQQKMSSGELKPSLPADATPEQTAEYRKLHGIPETFDGYLKELPSGLIVGEEDRVLYDDFAKHMHAQNAPASLVKAAIEWQYKFQEGISKADADKAAQFRRDAEDGLRAEWGPTNYRENIDRGGEILGMAPADIRDQLPNARLPDGTQLGDHPGVLKWLASISRELNPVRTLVPSGGMPGQGLDEEIKSIETKIQTPGSGYWKDDALQARYRDLLDARDRQKARAA